MKQIVLEENQTTNNHNKNYIKAYNHDMLMKQKLKKSYFNNAVAIRKEVLITKNKRKRKRKFKSNMNTIPAPKKRKYMINNKTTTNPDLMHIDHII